MAVSSQHSSQSLWPNSRAALASEPISLAGKSAWGGVVCGERGLPAVIWPPWHRLQTHDALPGTSWPMEGGA